MKKYFNSLNTRQKIFVSLIFVVFLAQCLTAILAFASIMKCSYSVEGQAENLSSFAQGNAESVLVEQNREILVKSASSMTDSAKLLLKQAEKQLSELCYSVESAYTTGSASGAAIDKSKIERYAIDGQTISKESGEFAVYKNSGISKDKIAVSENEMPEDVHKEFELLGNTVHTMQSVCANNENISGIYIATGTGILYKYGKADSAKPFDPRTKAWYKDAAAEAKNNKNTCVWQKSTLYDDANRPHIVCSKAYFNSSGAIKGVIAVELHADKLCEQITKTMTSETRDTFVFDNKQGALVGDESTDSEFRAGFGDSSDAYSELVMAMKNNECATIDVLAKDGRAYLVSCAPVEDIGWSVGIAQKNDVAFGERDTIKQEFLDEIARYRKESGLDTSNILFQFFIIWCALGVVLYALCGALTKKVAPFAEADQKDAKEYRKLNAELEMAQKIQKGMLPKVAPFDLGRDDLEIYATNVSAEKVGGDFYDFFFLDDRRLALVIADASDKGMPAALLMSAAKKLIKTHIKGSGSLESSMEAVNDSLYENNDMRMFVTAFVGIIDLYEGKMEYINAGHNPPLFYSTKKGRFEFLGGPHNCALGGIKGKKYAVGNKKISRNDALLLYTDGVTESADSDKRMLSQEGLKELVNRGEMKRLTMEKLIKTIQKELVNFSRDGGYKDDVTMLGFRNLGQQND